MRFDSHRRRIAALEAATYSPVVDFLLARRYEDDTDAAWARFRKERAERLSEPGPRVVVLSYLFTGRASGKRPRGEPIGTPVVKSHSLNTYAPRRTNAR